MNDTVKNLESFVFSVIPPRTKNISLSKFIVWLIKFIYTGNLLAILSFIANKGNIPQAIYLVFISLLKRKIFYLIKSRIIEFFLIKFIKRVVNIFYNYLEKNENFKTLIYISNVLHFIFKNLIYFILGIAIMYYAIFSIFAYYDPGCRPNLILSFTLLVHICILQIARKYYNVPSWLIILHDVLWHLYLDLTMATFFYFINSILSYVVKMDAGNGGSSGQNPGGSSGPGGSGGYGGSNPGGGGGPGGAGGPGRPNPGGPVFPGPGGVSHLPPGAPIPSDRNTNRRGFGFPDMLNRLVPVYIARPVVLEQHPDWWVQSTQAEEDKLWRAKNKVMYGIQQMHIAQRRNGDKSYGTVLRWMEQNLDEVALLTMDEKLTLVVAKNSTLDDPTSYAFTDRHGNLTLQNLYHSKFLGFTNLEVVGVRRETHIVDTTTLPKFNR